MAAEGKKGISECNTGELATAVWAGWTPNGFPVKLPECLRNEQAEAEGECGCSVE
jgi:hypothetical protein